MRPALPLAALALLVVCCREEEAPVPRPSPPPVVDERLPLVAFLGDSLTAGFGLPREEAFPHRVGKLLADRGHEVRILNAGVSGDTSAEGLSRLPWLLRQAPAILVVELGANDGLRGLPAELVEDNLRAIIVRARGAGVRVLLAGMKIPPSYGRDYAERFEGVFRELARELEVPLVPFLLEGVAGHPELTLEDGIHPNGVGQERIAETLVPYLEELLGAL